MASSLAFVTVRTGLATSLTLPSSPPVYFTSRQTGSTTAKYELLKRTCTVIEVGCENGYCCPAGYTCIDSGKQCLLGGVSGLSTVAASTGSSAVSTPAAQSAISPYSRGLSSGEIAGVVIAIVVAIGLIVGATIIFKRRQRVKVAKNAMARPNGSTDFGCNTIPQEGHLTPMYGCNTGGPHEAEAKDNQVVLPTPLDHRDVEKRSPGLIKDATQQRHISQIGTKQPGLSDTWVTSPQDSNLSFQSGLSGAVPPMDSPWKSVHELPSTPIQSRPVQDPPSERPSARTIEHLRQPQYQPYQLPELAATKSTTIN